jgi:hypothetical protein
MKAPMNISNSFVVAAMLISSCTAAVAQSGPSPVVPTLNVSAESYTRYPSLQPLNAIRLLVADAQSGTFDAVKKAITDLKWDCTSVKFYKVEVVDKSQKPLREVVIVGVRPNEDDPATPGERYKSCNVTGHPASLNLILGSQIDTNDLIRVTLYADSTQTTILAQSNGQLSFSSVKQFTFTATPQSATSEALTNGKSRDVGQLSVALAETNLIPSSPINVYAKSTDLFSTDGKDAKSSFAGTFGAQRGVFPNWYAPLHLEETIQGNQTATNLSAVTSLGITTLFPWSHSKPVFNNSVISAPLPPDLNLSTQYTHRIEQLVTSKTPLLSKDDYSLNSYLSWSSITFPATCKLFTWLNKSQTTGGGYCVGVAIDLGLWYLPFDLTTKKSQRVEGYGDASILIPLAGFSFASKVFPYITSSDPTKVQIQIKYSDSVNAANNYARTKGWSYGLQVLK